MTRQRPGDQPQPTPSDRPLIHELVIDDVRARLALGVERYGTGLQAHNGRDSLRDAYEEALDLACYLRQRIEEEAHPPATTKSPGQARANDASRQAEAVQGGMPATYATAQALRDAMSPWLVSVRRGGIPYPTPGGLRATLVENAGKFPPAYETPQPRPEVSRTPNALRGTSCPYPGPSGIQCGQLTLGEGVCMSGHPYPPAVRRCGWMMSAGSVTRPPIFCEARLNADGRCPVNHPERRITTHPHYR